MATKCCAPETPPTTSAEAAKGINEKNPGGMPGGMLGGMPVILVPLDGQTGAEQPDRKPRAVSARTTDDFQLLDDAYIKKHFKLPSRPLYMDPSKRPLITFPMTQDMSNNFNMARKNKINQSILDGILDASAAISSPGTHPYSKHGKGEKKKDQSKEDEEEIIYILQLPDWETQCPIHNQTVKTPRFIWHSCKTSKDKTVTAAPGGPTKRPKPWLLSRHTDFDLMSQW